MSNKPTYKELEQRVKESDQAIIKYKQIEKELQESQFLFSEMFEQSTTSIQLFDPDGYCQRVNPKFCKMFGVQAEDIIDGKYNILKDHNLMSPRITKLVEGIFYEKRVNRWEGQYDIGISADLFGISTAKRKQIDIDILGYPILDNSGQLKYVVLRTHDITERKQARQALRESEEKYKTVFHTNPGSVVIADLDGLCLEINDGFTQATGYSAEEVIGKTTADINLWVIPEDRKKVVAGVERDGYVKNLETIFRRKDGSHMTGLMSASIIELNNMSHLLSITHDITERKQAEKALRESEFLFTQMFEQSTTSMCLYNPEGTIFRINPEFSKMFGVDTDLFIDSGYNVFEDQTLKNAGIIPLLKEIFDEKKTNKWEIDFNFEISSESTKTPTSKGGQIYLEVFGYPILDNESNLKYVVLQHYDITDSKAAEKALKQSQHRLATHVKLIPMGVIEFDNEFIITSWNPGAEKIFGYTAEEAINCNTFDILVPEYERESVRKIHLWDDPRTTKNINDNKTKDDRIITCQWFNTPMLDVQGNVVGLTAVCEDITDRILAERELHLTKYSIDNSSSAAFWIKQNGQFRYANKAASLLTGYSHQELLEIYYWDLDHSFPQNAIHALWQELESKGVDTFESFCTDKKGRQIPVEVTANFQDFEGEKYIFAYVLDISERRNSEMERTRLVSAIEQSSDNIVITDIKGYIEYVNPAFERNTGYSRTEVFGQNPRILKSGKQSDDFYRNIWETITKGEIWTGNIINKRKDEELIEEFATIFPVLASSGEITNFVAVKRDMTGQNKMENQLSQMQKLDAVGTLASGIAHDFNNILGAIFGYTQLSKKKLPDFPENQKVVGYLDKIFSASGRAKELIDQILMFSRKSDFDPKILNLHPLVNETIKFLRATIPTTISINLSIDPDLRNINGDATQIQQVIMNLCTNASHAMEESGGTLEVALVNYQIESKAIDTGNLDPGDFLCITVSDTGKGMNDNTKQRIFEPFFTTKGKSKGTGLGLSVVYGIVNKHGGAIDVQSQEGSGTRFNIYFPACKNNAKETEKEVEPELPTGSESILFVDDETDLCDVYGEMLKIQGYQVQTTSSSQNALDRIIKNPDKYDLVITDYTMPEMNGTELCREIGKYSKQVPVILISGLGELIPDEELKSAGVVAKHSKPIKFGTLIRGVRDILDKQ